MSATASTAASAASSSSSSPTKQQQKPKSIPVSSAARRLAEALLMEAMEQDRSLCNTPRTFSEFVFSILEKTSSAEQTQHEQQKQQQQQQQQQNTKYKKQQQQHGGSTTATLTSDEGRFSNRCAEARAETASTAQQMIRGVIEERSRRKKLSSSIKSEQSSNNNNKNESNSDYNNGDEYDDDDNVVYLGEWREICRAHPILLKHSLERSMPRSEMTATALLHDNPVSIMPARRTKETKEQEDDDQDDDNGKNNSKSKNTISSSSSSSLETRKEGEGEALKQNEDDEKEEGSGSSKKKKRKKEEDDEGDTSSISAYVSSAAFSTWTYASDWASRVHQWIERLITGGIAGGVAKSVIAPGDRVKIIFQVNRKLVFTVAAAVGLAREIVQRNGVLGLWAGHGATLLRVVPYAAISFASFEFYHLTFRPFILSADELATEEGKIKRKSGEGAGSKRQILLRFVCGAAAGATATSVTYPLDLLRARYAAHSLHSTGKPYPSYFLGLKTIYRTEGAGSLYNGIGPTLLGIIPYAGASFTAFETFKAFILSKNPSGPDGEQATELATWQRLSAGALSGLIAQSMTYPLDIVRRRMQVDPKMHNSMWETLVTIYRHEGIRRGLYKGLSMNWIKGPIAVGVSFTINDHVKSKVKNYHVEVALRQKKSLQQEEEEEVEEIVEEVLVVEEKEEEKEPVSENSSSSASSSSTSSWSSLLAAEGKDSEKKQEVTGNNNNTKKKVVKKIVKITKKKKKLQEQNEEGLLLHFTERLACGALAGCAAKIWTVPFDRLKLMMSLGRVNHDGTPGHSFRTVRRLLSETRNPWQGGLGMLLRVAPFAALSYTMFDSCQPFAKRLALTTEPSFFSDMIAGSTAAAIATVVCHPMDVLRSRFALATSAPPFASYLQGLKNESVASLYTGIRPALAGVCPLAALSFAVYHAGKRNYDDGTFTTRLMLGGFAGVVGQLASYPLNIQRRKAISGFEDEISESLIHSVKAQYLKDGAYTFPSMYRRMPLGWTFGAASFGLSFAMHDFLKDLIDDLRKRQARDLLMKDPTV